MEAYTALSVNLAGADRPERVRGVAVGPDFLRTLGVEPALGRDLNGLLVEVAPTEEDVAFVSGFG